MKLEFTRLILNDFKDYRGKHVLDLVGLGFGLHFVAGDNGVDSLGSNGAGKSSLWDAFFWCVTGRTVRGLRGTDIVGWHISRPASVRLNFWVDDKKHWIKRSTKKNGLWLDGKLTSQEAIEQLLRLNATTIPHTVILGQKRDLFFDLKPAEKMAVLSGALDLDKWEDRSKRAADAVKKLNLDRDDLIRQAESAGRDEVKTLSQIQSLKALVSSWERERSDGAEQRAEQIKALRKAIENKKTEQAEFDLAYDSAETEIRAARKDLKKKQEALDDLTRKHAREDAALQSLIRRLEELRAIKDKCPTCGQVIRDKAQQKAHAKVEIKELGRKISAQMVKTKNANVAEEQARIVCKRIRKSIEEFGEKSDKAKDSFDHLASAMHKIELQITELKAKVRDDDVCPYEQPLADARKEYKQMRKDRQALKERLESFDIKLNRTQYWVKGFKNIRLYLLEEALDHMEAVTNAMLPTFGLDGWTVQYDTEKVSKKGTATPGLTVTILKPGMRKGVRWEAWSGGEGQRLLIAGALAFSSVILERAGIDCDFIVLDEPTRHMSREGVTQTIDCLIDWARDRQVFYTDHQAVQSSRFASVVTISKDENGSRIHA